MSELGLWFYKEGSHGLGTMFHHRKLWDAPHPLSVSPAHLSMVPFDGAVSIHGSMG